MEKVVNFSKPHAGLVELLEELLAEAKAGNMIAIAGVALRPKNVICEFKTSNTKQNIYFWIGLVRALQMSLEHMIEVCEDCGFGGCSAVEEDE